MTTLSKQTQVALQVGGQSLQVFSLKKLAAVTQKPLHRLPYSIRILVENLLRNLDGYKVKEQDVRHALEWNPKAQERAEIPFMPARVVMQDLTGVAAVVDLAAMRDAFQKAGGDPQKINPLVDTALVVDHSVQVDYYGTPTALAQNVGISAEQRTIWVAQMGSECVGGF
jgi:aconitate hydratase